MVLLRRPTAIYLIALWWWIAFDVAVFRGIGHLVPSGAKSTTVNPLPPAMVLIVFVMAVCVLVWETILLLQLRAKAFWFLSLFLGAWSVFLISRLPWVFRHGEALSGVVIAVLALNLVVIGYVFRPGFRARCAQFQRQREEDALRRRVERDSTQSHG